MCGISPVPDKMPPGFTWIHNQAAGDAIVSVAVNRVARGKTLVVTGKDDLEEITKKGTN